MLEIKDKFLLDDNIVLRSINDMFWALDTRKGAQYKLNRVSYDILSSLDGELSLEEIIESISKKYNVEQNLFCMDTLNFLDKMLSKNIIKRR